MVATRRTRSASPARRRKASLSAAAATPQLPSPSPERRSERASKQRSHKVVKAEETTTTTTSTAAVVAPASVPMTKVVAKDATLPCDVELAPSSNSTVIFLVIVLISLQSVTLGVILQLCPDIQNDERLVGLVGVAAIGGTLLLAKEMFRYVSSTYISGLFDCHTTQSTFFYFFFVCQIQNNRFKVKHKRTPCPATTFTPSPSHFSFLCRPERR